MEVVPRDQHAADDIANWMHLQKPTPGYRERCYYHKYADNNGRASIYQPKLNVGLEELFFKEPYKFNDQIYICV